MNSLKPGVVINIDGEPYEILESQHSKVARRQATTSAKLKSLTSGKVLTRTFQQSDKFEEADTEKVSATFKYRTREDFFFVGEKGEKFNFTQETLGDKIDYLKPGFEVRILLFEESPVSLELPVKVVLEVTDAPPSEKGDTAQGGTKEVELETGGKVKVPLFVKTGDKIEINTQTGEYSRRVNE